MSTGKRRPGGFAVLAVCAALFGVLASLALAGDEGDVVASAVLTVWGSLGLLTAEALWRVRRWAFAASSALAGSVLAPGVILAVLAVVTGDVGTAVMTVLIGGLLAVGVHPVLEYVHDRSRALHPAPPAPP